MSGTARQKIQRWVFVLTFLLGIPAALIGASMPFLDVSHATYLTATKDYKGAINALNRAISMNGLLSIAYVKRGYDYEALNQPEKAMADYDRAVQVNPGDWSAYNNRAWLQLNGDIGRAAEDANKAVELCSDCAQALHTRAMVRMKSNDFGNALADLNRAIELDPKFGQAYLDRAACKKALNQPDSDQDEKRAEELGVKPLIQ